MAAKEAEVLPALDIPNNDAPLTRLTVEHTDKDYTIQDLHIINNALEMTLGCYDKIRTLAGLVTLNDHVMEILKTRRGVMKLPYGASKGAPKKGRVIEALD